MPKTNGTSVPETSARHAPIFLTPQAAADLTGRSKKAIAKAIDDPKYAHLFNNDTIRRHEFPGYPTIVEVEQGALRAWVDATERYANAVGARKARSDKGRRWVIRIPDALHDQVVSALGAIDPTLTLETGYKPRAKASDNAESSEETPVSTDKPPTFEHELVEA